MPSKGKHRFVKPTLTLPDDSRAATVVNQLGADDDETRRPCLGFAGPFGIANLTLLNPVCLAGNAANILRRGDGPPGTSVICASDPCTVYFETPAEAVHDILQNGTIRAGVAKWRHTRRARQLFQPVGGVPRGRDGSPRGTPHSNRRAITVTGANAGQLMRPARPDETGSHQHCQINGRRTWLRGPVAEQQALEITRDEIHLEIDLAPRHVRRP